LRRSLSALLAVSSLLVLGLSNPASASHSWGKYHWGRTTTPFNLTVGNNVTEDWGAAYTAVIADWARSNVVGPVAASGRTNGVDCAASNGRVEACSARYGDTGWLGLAQIWSSRGHIVAGTAKVNDTYYAAGSSYATSEQRQDVMCQEIGHTFGLDHTSTDGRDDFTCMDYSDATSSYTANDHDFAQLRTIYGHTDRKSAVTVASTSTRGQGNDRGSWGREVSRSKDGRSSTFVRDLGDGEQVLTFVDWAAPQR